MKESVLRDMIAQNIHKLDPHLTLIQKEKYIPGLHSSSFIDLYAKDEKNRHVLIEVKCSCSAAREAIHEVIKSMENIKRHFGVNDQEVRVIIASVEWEELLTTFSRVHSEMSFLLEGLKINITDGGYDFEAETVSPLPVIRGRFIAPWHNVYWYSDENSFRNGLAGIEHSYLKKGIDDYIIVKMQFEDNLTGNERKAMFKTAVSRVMNVPANELDTDNISVPVYYKYIAYTAVQILTEEKCLQLLSLSEDGFEEVQETFDDTDMNETEKLYFLHKSIEAMEPLPDSDYRETSNPAKFSQYFDAENFSVDGIVRHGIFERNNMLSDDMIYSELKGENGSTRQKLKQTVEMNDHALVRSFIKDIEYTLEYNPVWRSHVLNIIKEIEREFPYAKADITIFNPGTGLFTVYHAMTRKQGFLYLPSYQILVMNPDCVRIYFGALGENGTALTFDEILLKHYDGNLANLMITAAWGGTDSRDSDIIEDIGAQYRSYRFDISDDKPVNFAVFHDEKWRESDMVSLIELFQMYAESNEILVRQILRTIGERMSPDLNFFTL